MFVSGRRGAVITTLLQDVSHTYARLGNGAAWSVATLPAIKVNSHPFRLLGILRTQLDVRGESVTRSKADTG